MLNCVTCLEAVIQHFINAFLVILLLVKNSLVNREVWDLALLWCNRQSLCCQSSGWSLHTFSAFTIKCHSSMQNWMPGLPGWIICKQSIPLMQTKNIWACSWFCCSPASPFSVSVNLDSLYTAHAFFPERLSNYCQDLHHTFSDIYTKFAAVPLLDPLQNHIRPVTRLQIKGHKKSAHPPSWVKFCTLTPKICIVLSFVVASHYYNFCIDGSTNLGNYTYPLVWILNLVYLGFSEIWTSGIFLCSRKKKSVKTLRNKNRNLCSA
jgi:hypothetical protein